MLDVHHGWDRPTPESTGTTTWHGPDGTPFSWSRVGREMLARPKPPTGGAPVVTLDGHVLRVAYPNGVVALVADRGLIAIVLP